MPQAIPESFRNKRFYTSVPVRAQHEMYQNWYYRIHRSWTYAGCNLGYRSFDLWVIATGSCIFVLKRTFHPCVKKIKWNLGFYIAQYLRRSRLKALGYTSKCIEAVPAEDSNPGRRRANPPLQPLGQTPAPVVHPYAFVTERNALKYVCFMNNLA
jgi:hypothetical protein